MAPLTFNQHQCPTRTLLIATVLSGCSSIEPVAPFDGHLAEEGIGKESPQRQTQGPCLYRQGSLSEDLAHRGRLWRN